LEFHILQLLSAKENSAKVKSALDNEIELLKKHNNYLRDMPVRGYDDAIQAKVVIGGKKNQNCTAFSGPLDRTVPYFDQVN
jgi:hypothetical protein